MQADVELALRWAESHVKATQIPYETACRLLRLAKFNHEFVKSHTHGPMHDFVYTPTKCSARHQNQIWL
jgi:hypothetical protein